MKSVSVVITTLNEEQSTGKLLSALTRQTLPPDEVMIVDAGSQDRTTEIIRKFQQKYRRIRLLVKPGDNRSQGRNQGIKRAHSPIIATTDAGCIPKRDWLKKLTAPFADKTLDLVGGYYQPTGTTSLQRALAVYTSVLPHQLNPKRFLPAARSMAFRKHIWEKVGGFPEELTTCEDRVFVDRLLASGAKYRFVPEAVVLWEQEKTLSGAFRQLQGYARGDVQASYAPHLRRISLVWLRYLLAFLIILVEPRLFWLTFFLYCLWSIQKGHQGRRDLRSIVWLPLLQITADTAVLSGSILGIWQKFQFRSL